jgi:hypothetical protein
MWKEGGHDVTEQGVEFAFRGCHPIIVDLWFCMGFSWGHGEGDKKMKILMLTVRCLYLS